MMVYSPFVFNDWISFSQDRICLQILIFREKIISFFAQSVQDKMVPIAVMKVLGTMQCGCRILAKFHVHKEYILVVDNIRGRIQDFIQKFVCTGVLLDMDQCR